MRGTLPGARGRSAHAPAALRNGEPSPGPGASGGHGGSGTRRHVVGRDGTVHFATEKDDPVQVPAVFEHGGALQPDVVEHEADPRDRTPLQCAATTCIGPANPCVPGSRPGSRPSVGSRPGRAARRAFPRSPPAHGWVSRAGTAPPASCRPPARHPSARVSKRRRKLARAGSMSSCAVSRRVSYARVTVCTRWGGERRQDPELVCEGTLPGIVGEGPRGQERGAECGGDCGSHGCRCHVPLPCLPSLHARTVLPGSGVPVGLVPSRHVRVA